MGNNGKTVLNSFSDLAGVMLAPPPADFSLHELLKIEIGDIASIKVEAEKICQDATRIKGWVVSTLGQLEALMEASRETRELAAEKIAVAQKSLQDLLNHMTPAYRRATWLGLLEFEFSRQLNSRKEVEELLDRLVEENRLLEDSYPPTADLRVYGKAYSVHPDSFFEESEVTEIRQLLATLLSRVFQSVGRARKEKAEELRGKGTISLWGLFSGKSGKCAADVPPEKAISDGKDWRPGGVLLVRSDGQKIFPIDVSGGIEGGVRAAKDLGVYLLVESLRREAPPFPRLPAEQVGKVQLLWHLLKRAIRHEKEKERIESSRQQLAAKATISPEAFFPEQMPDICLAELHGTWQNPDGSAGPSNIFFLIERKQEEGVKRIHLVETPKHLDSFFAQCMGEYIEGDKFEGCPQPLRAVLMAIYRQTLQASKDAAKADQIANGNK